MNRKAESKTDRMATLACLCSLCTCLVAHAEDKSAEIDGVVYYYWINGCEANRNKQVFLGHCSPRCAVEIPDDCKRIVIPKVINGETIEGICGKAFHHLVDVEEIVLPEGIVSIGYETFSECWSLKKINIPSSVCEIEGRAFRDCESLKTVTLPDNISITGEEVFKNCKSLEEFEFPRGVCVCSKNGGCDVNRARENKRLAKRRGQDPNARSSRRRTRASVVDEEPVEHGPYDGLLSGFFAGCSSLKRIALPSSFNYVGSQAFEGCASLTKIDLPPSIKKIGDYAFRGCKSLETINLPESVVEIGAQAFNGCSRLKSIVLPYRITKIEGGGVHEGGTFANCKSLREISIPENVKEIGMYAFQNCTSLQKVSFSPDIQNIRLRDAAFAGCTSLKEIVLPRCIADSVLNANIDYRDDSNKLRELPGLKITYLD